MKILIINEVLGTTSTGKICAEQAVKFEADGHEVKVAYGRWKSVPEAYKKYAIRIGTRIDVLSHVLASRLFDKHGFGSRLATKRFLKWVEEYSPDLIWMHNIHGYYINIEMLFNWLRHHPNIEKKWTLHDCWAVTGHCAHFDYVGCQKWQNKCKNCCQIKEYPKAWFRDNSENNYEKKKTLFEGLINLTIVTPSEWLANIIRKSILKQYQINVCRNTVDKRIFRPNASLNSNEKEKIVLGVASVWTLKKGLEDFYQLANILGEDYKVMLVGLNNKQIKNLPHNVFGCKKTNNVQELVKIYQSSYVFVNLTYEDTYPTVNLEAQACGIPCITYDSGGSAENVPAQNVVSRGNVEGVADLIINHSFFVREYENSV